MSFFPRIPNVCCDVFSSLPPHKEGMSRWATRALRIVASLLVFRTLFLFSSTLAVAGVLFLCQEEDFCF